MGEYHLSRAPDDVPAAPAKRHTALRRAGGVAAAALVASLLAGCVHVGETATVKANGSSTEVVTMTLSPKFSALAHTSPSQALNQVKAQSKKFPGKVSISPFKDSAGWKGIKVVIQLNSLAELKKLETTSSGGASSSSMFSTFSITHHGSKWALLAKINTSGLSAGSGASKSNPFGNLFSKKAMEATGMKFVISFKLPGRPVSSNATSTAANGTLSWNLFALKATTLRGTWATG